MNKRTVVIGTLLAFAIIFLTPFLSAFSQRNNSSSEDFRVLVSLFGLKPDMNQIFVFVTLQNSTKGSIHNTTTIDLGSSNETVTDGIAEIPIAFQDVFLEPGEKYRACVLIFKDPRLICQTGFNSPVVRTEFASIGIPEKARSQQ